MLPVAILALLLLGLSNYLYFGRRLLSPAVVFCFLWALDLFAIWCLGTMFYTLSTRTLAILLVGAVSLSAGSACTLLIPTPSRTRDEFIPSKSVLNILVTVVLLLAPFYVMSVIRLASQYNSSNILIGAKIAFATGSSNSLSLGPILGNLAPLSMAVAAIAFLEVPPGRLRAAVVVVISLLINLLTGSRSWAITLLLALAAIDWLRNQRLRWKLWVSTSAFILICFSSLALFMGKTGSADDSLLADSGAVLQSIAVYACGGTVGFDRVVRDPGLIVHNQQVYQQALPVARKLDPELRELPPNIDINFVPIGPGTLTTNVFTAYASYLDWGIAGYILFPLITGFVTTLCFNSAVGGNRIAMVLYGFLFADIVLSLFAEYFFITLNTLVRILILVLLVYRLPKPHIAQAGADSDFAFL